MPFTFSRSGQRNAAGDDRALYLKVFAGEVLTAFQQKQVMMDKHQVMTISHGKSASFPVVGTVSARYMKPGDELAGDVIQHGERIITIDDLLTASTTIANIDEAMNHYDTRSIYSNELGQALANTADKQLLQLAVLAARTAGTEAGEPGGSVITNANAASDSEALIASIFAAAQTFDEKDVAEDERYFFVRPAAYYKLAQNTKLMNKDWGGAGVYADGKVLRVAGMALVPTNHMPNSNVAAGTVLAGTGDKYAGDFSTTVGVAVQRQCLGTVKLLDLAIETEYETRRQGTFVVAKYAMGHGVLRPACAIEVKTA